MKNLLLLVLLGAASISFSQVKTETVAYFDGSTELEGYIAYPSNNPTAPTILIVHQWKGLTDYEKKRAEMLAELGYVAFAVDIYGKGVRPKTPEESGKQAGMYRNNRPLFRQRILAALDKIKTMSGVNTQQVAAIGYCFGGTGVLELARSGADIDGVVSFHGGLSTPTPEDAKNITGKVLVLHGAIDPNVPREDVNSFITEMQNGGVDYYLVEYGNAVHSFTDWNAGSDITKGSAYNEQADKRSWEEMQDFFNQIFK